jgi:hypothetical protein
LCGRICYACQKWYAINDISLLTLGRKYHWFGNNYRCWTFAHVMKALMKRMELDNSIFHVDLGLNDEQTMKVNTVNPEVYSSMIEWTQSIIFPTERRIRVMLQCSI